MRAISITLGCFSTTAAIFLLIMAAFRPTDSTHGQENRCPPDEVFRASDKSCYVLQGE
jgi:hypothetical protein